MSDEGNNVNKESWFWNAPEYFNRWRVFSRAFIIFYFWLAYVTAMWFMALADPTPAQAGFAGAVIAAGAAWFGLYVNSGPITVNTNNNNAPSMPSYTTAPPTTAYRPRNRRNETNEDFDNKLDDEPKG